MNEKKVSILGHFGFGKSLLNGQTIKTTIITDEIEKKLGIDQVLRIDTHGGIKTLIKAPFQVFLSLKNSDNVLIFPAHNGLKVYAPLLCWQRRLFKKRKIHYVVIGGWLSGFLLEHRYLARVLKDFDGIYVETNSMKSELEKQGFDNVYVLPNCKKLTVLSENKLIYPTKKPYKLCTFSRVMKEKGIEEAVDAIIIVNDILGDQVFSLDIYGQVDSSQIEWFKLLQKRFPQYIRYVGEVPFDKSVEVLKEYLALLFPTYYEGEGFAGTLIDAYSAGVPVIASDWKYNSELVNENVGYVYPTGNQEEFANILMMVAMNPKILIDKKRLCLKEADNYRIDKVIQVLLDKIEGE